MKRILSIFLSTLLMAALFTACAGSSNPAGGSESGKISVVATIFPQYDFVRQIAGDHAELTMLLPPGSESHSYEPTPQDIISIQNCDMFIYVGGESDTWIDDILESMDTSKMEIVSLMDLVDTVEEEIVEGMEDDHDHSHDGEIHEEDIEDRPLSDFEGSWQSVLPYFEDGTLDEYIAATAEKNETTPGEEKAGFLEKRATDYMTIDITDDGLTVHTDTGSASGSYAYAEYRPVRNEDGEITSVWYIYQLSGPAEGMPAYIAFSDHEIKARAHDDDHGDDHDEDHDHEDELAHFHIRYGNDGIDALMDVKNWAPTYYPAGASAEEIKDALAGHDHSHEAEYDEHVWTSPKNAMTIVQALSDKLCALDSANSAAYEQNTAAYLEKLGGLDSAFRSVVEEGSRKTLVFGDRFPFRYFVDAYDLAYFAAFPGCSTETEASAATVAFLIDKVKDEQIPVVFHIELSNEKMADTICEFTGAEKRLLHSCHNITKAEFESGVTYLDLMTQNVETLREALN